MHIFVCVGGGGGGEKKKKTKTQQERFLITQQDMSIILLMHEQMLNDPRLNITNLFTNIKCIIRTNRKGHKNVHL